MKQLVQFLGIHGYWLLFIAVLCRQACLPVPANLLLVAAGTLVGMRRLDLAAILLCCVGAFLVADMAWYAAGRRWGGRTLEFVCGASHDPSACVQKISTRFARHGVKLLLISKFIIGVDAVAAPMSGISHVELPRFLAFDALGALLWSSVYIGLGYIFTEQLDRVAATTASLGRLLVFVGIAALGVMLILRLVRWYRFLHKFALARISPEELNDKLKGGARILVLDLHGGLNQAQTIPAIPGAVRIDPAVLGQHMKNYRGVDLGTDREVVLYCASLGQATSARVAIALRQRGFTCVRPLAGGLEAWRNRGFEITLDVQMLPAPEHSVYLLHEVLRFSRRSAAEALKTSVGDIDRLLERAIKGIRRSDSPHRASLPE